MRHIDNDNYLLSALQKGGSAAFDSIFRKYYPILCAYASRFVMREEAEDIAEDTLLWLWEHKDYLEIDASLGAYLIRAVYHKAMNRIRQEELKNRADTLFFEEMQKMMKDDNFMQFKELSDHIKEAIQSLPDSYREAFIMHRFKKMTYKEIAETLQVSPKTVDYRIQKALSILRIRLTDYLPVLLFLSDWDV